jgi:hypothetical protein
MNSRDRLSIVTNPMVYYHKPSIGDQPDRDGVTPVHVIFPSGGISIALSSKPRGADDHSNNDGAATIASGPSDAAIDKRERFFLRLSFVLIGILNIVITSLLFQHAHIVDTSLVEAPQNGGIQSSLTRVPLNRTYSEQVNFGFLITFLVIGMSGAIFENTTALSMYALGIVSNFVLGSYSLPYFAFSLRYVLDIFMLYCGLILRSRYMYSFLPLYLQTNDN